jgi:hypothetical protein
VSFRFFGAGIEILADIEKTISRRESRVFPDRTEPESEVVKNWTWDGVNIDTGDLEAPHAAPREYVSWRTGNAIHELN